MTTMKRHRSKAPPCHKKSWTEESSWQTPPCCEPTPFEEAQLGLIGRSKKETIFIRWNLCPRLFWLAGRCGWLDSCSLNIFNTSNLALKLQSVSLPPKPPIFS